MYEPNSNGRYADGMRIKENWLELTGYRLPAEKEWEYACRAGTSETYGFGEPAALLDHYGWWVKTSLGRSHPVESLLPNAAGLFDMHGNLWEWIQNPNSGSMSPVRTGVTRVLRGGAFSDQESILRSVHTGHFQLEIRLPVYGFRPASTYTMSDGR